MHIISKSGEYGLRALLFMVTNQEKGEYVSIREMAEKLNISFHFLTKILQVLTQKGFLQSYRGPNGGIAFLVQPENILLIDLIKALEGDDIFDKCLLGLPGCGKQNPCPLHDFWAATKEKLQEKFETTTLADLGLATKEKGFRLIA